MSSPTNPYFVHVMPPQAQCQNLLSSLMPLNQTEENRTTKEYRSVFPYGAFDEKDVREFIAMHNAKKTAYEVICEKRLSAQADLVVNRPFGSTHRKSSLLNVIMISEYNSSMLKSNLWSRKSSDAVIGNLTTHQLATLACDRLVTEDVLQHVFSLINRKYVSQQ